MTESTEFVWPVMDHTKGTWLGSEELKAWVLAKMIGHRGRDELIRGVYQDEELSAGEYRGCLIGCTLPRRRRGNSTHHLGYTLPGAGFVAETGDREMDVETLYGIDLHVGKLLEAAFEKAHSFEEAADFAVESIRSIPVGVRYPGSWGSEGPGWPDHLDLSAVLEFLRTAGVPA